MKIKKYNEYYNFPLGGGESISTKFIVDDFKENSPIFDELYQKLRKLAADFYVNLEDHFMMNGKDLNDDEMEKLFDIFWKELNTDLEDLPIDSAEHLSKDVKKYNL